MDSATERTGSEIRVGESDVDVCGCTGQAIQLAMDAAAQRGGGTVRLSPGVFAVAGPLRLHSRVRLSGAGEATVLRPWRVVASPLAVDADIGEKQITPEDASLFVPGMGLILRDRTKPNGNATMPLTISRVSNGVLHTTGWVEKDYTAEDGGVVLSYFPLIHGHEIEDVVVENLVLDGAVEDAPPALEGVWGGNLYLRRVNGAIVQNVMSRRCYGDGLRFGQSRGILVQGCEIGHNHEYGIHPGSHTKGVQIRDCYIHDNGSDGLYVCWGVQNSVFAGNEIHHNGHGKHRNGFCIGHKDTDNVIENNHIYENHKHGIHVRRKTEANGAHRNLFRNNTVENNGVPLDQVPEDLRAHVPEQELLGCGIYVNGVTHDLRFVNNVVRETREGEDRSQRVGLYLEPGVSGTMLEGNVVEGHPHGDVQEAK